VSGQPLAVLPMERSCACALFFGGC